MAAHRGPCQRAVGPLSAVVGIVVRRPDVRHIEPEDFGVMREEKRKGEWNVT